MRPRSIRCWWGFLLMAAVVVPAVAAGGGVVAAQSTPVVREYLGEEFSIVASARRVRVCLGEPVTITVTVRRFGVYQDVEERWYVPRPRPVRVERGQGVGQGDVTYEVDNPGVLSLAPGQVTSQYAGGAFTFHVSATAEDIGTAQVDFLVEGPGVRSASTSLSIEVTECDYEVHTFSIWHMSAGRQIVASTSIDTVIRREGTSRDFITLVARPTPMAENLAVSFPYAECPISVTASKTSAPVLGVVIMADYTLRVNIEYGDVAGGAETGCMTPLGYVGATSTGPATPDDIAFVMSAAGGADSSSHILRAPGLGDFSGMTYITVTPIHR